MMPEDKLMEVQNGNDKECKWIKITGNNIIILLLAIKGSNEIVDPISTMKTTENKLKNFICELRLPAIIIL
jgi:hypothetical protein